MECIYHVCVHEVYTVAAHSPSPANGSLLVAMDSDMDYSSTGVPGTPAALNPSTATRNDLILYYSLAGFRTYAVLTVLVLMLFPRIKRNGLHLKLSYKDSLAGIIQLESDADFQVLIQLVPQIISFLRKMSVV